MKTIARKIADSYETKSNRIKLELDFKISDFAHKSGVHEDALSQLLKGVIKNPGVYTVAKIADTLGCSVDELASDIDRDTQTELKLQLARSCITTTVDLLREKKQQVSFDEFLCILRIVYKDSLNKKARSIDAKFAALCINDFLQDKNAER